MKEPGIYAIICSMNDCVYIGQAVDLQRRWIGHRYALQRGDHGNQRLQRIYDKHGQKCLTFVPILFCKAEQLDDKETLIIQLMKRFIGNRCLNIGREGARNWLGMKHSAATKKKMAASARRRIRKPFSNEARMRMKIGAQRRCSSSAERLRMSTIARKKRSPQARARMKAAAFLRWAGKHQGKTV
jgi:group I intron endonuclease